MDKIESPNFGDSDFLYRFGDSDSKYAVLFLKFEISNIVKIHCIIAMKARSGQYYLNYFC